MIIVMLSDDDVENSVVEDLDNISWGLNNG